MYAVIESGGKQYRVELGSEIQVDRLDVAPGDAITLDRVLLVADEDAATVGRPFVDGAVVNADVVDQARGDKVVVFKYRPKARRRVKKGFRASLTTLRISDIAFAGTSAAKDAAKDERRREQAEREAEQAAAERAAADQALASRLAQAETSQEAAPPKRTRAARSSAPKDGAATADASETAATETTTSAAGDEAPADQPDAVARASEAAADGEAAEAAVEGPVDGPVVEPPDAATETDQTDKDE
jgi:large subunit ribosomal protein L21